MKEWVLYSMTQKTITGMYRLEKYSRKNWLNYSFVTISEFKIALGWVRSLQPKFAGQN